MNIQLFYYHDFDTILAPRSDLLYIYVIFDTSFSFVEFIWFFDISFESTDFSEVIVSRYSQLLLRIIFTIGLTYLFF